MPNKKFRAICIHGLSTLLIWRGPIRADRNLAEIDLKDHLKSCTLSQDSSIIQEGDPGWEEDKV
jgi:hypothetical protein